MMGSRSEQSGFTNARRHGQPAFIQHKSGQRSHRIALKTVRMRASALNPGRVSAIMEPVPERLASPQGPVAQFYKEPKTTAAAKTPPPLPPQLQSPTTTCIKTAEQRGFTEALSATSSRWVCPVLACHRRPLPGAGRGWEEKCFKWGKSSGGISALICGLTNSIKPGWHLDHRDRLLMAH